MTKEELFKSYSEAKREWVALEKETYYAEQSGDNKAKQEAQAAQKAAAEKVRSLKRELTTRGLLEEYKRWIS